jgi:DUF1680 family protein
VTARDDGLGTSGMDGRPDAAWDAAEPTSAPDVPLGRPAVDRRRIVGAVLPTAGATTRLWPVGGADVELTDGLWAERRQVNRERTLGHGFAELTRVGTLQNFRLAAGAQGTYRALGAASGTIFPFLDTDAYKWLEAVGWELGQAPDPDLSRSADEAIDLIARAQRPDGYLNTYVQVVAGGRPYQDLAWGHELYCFGHLIQAAVAWQRALGDDRLLSVATRVVDSIERELVRPGGVALDGHPEIEMALVELYRTTADRRHLELASAMIDARGRGLLGEGRFGPAYWQDHLPVREATGVAGHAVRQLYLDCGAVDVAVETGDAGLLDAVVARWRDMVATRTYLTGGLGSRARDEAFGDPYELPPDLAYAETCASIASVMLAWRLLLATGDPACADLIERTIYNGVLPGLGQNGTSFFYTNVLQRRTDRAAARPGEGDRVPWMACACCPPNVMRTLSSWPQYLATTDTTGLQLHQYAAGTIGADLGGERIRVRIDTAYPWDGAVRVTIVETPTRPWTLSLRVPAWSRLATFGDATGEIGRLATDDGVVRETRTWRAGEAVVLGLDMAIRLTAPDPRIDAVRGCLAVERGPLVYCLETADLPVGRSLEELALDPAVAPSTVDGSVGDAAVVGVRLGARRRSNEVTAWPYTSGGPSSDARGEPIEVRAVPYFAWGNRSVDAMRVWIPSATEAEDPDPPAAHAERADPPA